MRTHAHEPESASVCVERKSPRAKLVTKKSDTAPKPARRADPARAPDPKPKSGPSRARTASLRAARARTRGGGGRGRARARFS